MYTLLQRDVVSAARSYVVNTQMRVRDGVTILCMTSPKPRTYKLVRLIAMSLLLLSPESQIHRSLLWNIKCDNEFEVANDVSKASAAD